MESLFRILGLTPTFSLNLKTLEDAYFAAQRLHHPDRWVGKPEAERVSAIRRSEMVNDAYETLKNPLRRAEHLLELQGLFPLVEDAVAPPALLMEIMELREQLEDAASDGASLARVVDELKSRATATTKALEAAFTAADYPAAALETQRLHYLGRAMEDAYGVAYRRGK